MDQSILNSKSFVSSMDKKFRISEVNGKFNLDDMVILELLNKSREYALCIYEGGNEEYLSKIKKLDNMILNLRSISPEICNLRTRSLNDIIYKSTNNI